MRIDLKIKFISVPSFIRKKQHGRKPKIFPLQIEDVLKSCINSIHTTFSIAT